VHVPRRDVNGIHRLPLRLAYRLLVKLVGSLKTIAGQEKIQMKSIFGVRTVIYAIKDIHSRTAIMNSHEFRSIEKAV